MTSIAPASLSRTARLCRALADENRLRIVELLSSGERCVCDLTSALDLGQSLLSHHLKTLKDAGLVIDRRDGRWVYYTLSCDALEELSETIESMVPAAGATQADGCCR